jgi:hypothetical protein
MKHHPLVEKDRGNACRKNREKNEPFFLANFFRGLSFYGADLTVFDFLAGHIYEVVIQTRSEHFCFYI